VMEDSTGSQEATPGMQARHGGLPALEGGGAVFDGGKDGGMRQTFLNQQDAPPCPDCGCIMVRNGACYKCMNCGTTSGCS
jgi:ribonucleoside-diphosphate reductase alpha chain